MIYSMTGYGKAENQVANNKKIVVEIRSLNSKSIDLSVRIAPQLRSKELDIRTLIAQRLERGKLDLSIYYQDTAQGEEASNFAPINREAFAYYYRELIALQKELGWNNNQDIVSAILRMPDVTKVQDCGDVSDEEWAVVLQTIEEAIKQFNAFREQEGASLYQMFCEKLDAIAALLTEVEPYEQSRVEKIKARIEANLEQLSAATQQAIDRNRLEQEMIYYIEKLDINEEKVRLTNHLKYFRETMGETTGVGKKLGFIAQEMAVRSTPSAARATKARCRVSW